MDWIDLGYLGLFLATFLAATIVPFSSEITVISMLYLGYSPFMVVLFASMGNIGGGMTTYYLGYLGKVEWLKKFFKVSEKKLYSFQQKIKKYGAYIALVTWLPLIGDVFSAALGFFKVNAFKVFIGMTIGRTLRFTIVALFWEELYAWMI